MLEKGLLGKLLKGTGIDLKDLIKESEKVPALLEILAEHSNKQTGAMKELATKEDIRNLKESLDTKLGEIRKNIDRILEFEHIKEDD